MRKTVKEVCAYAKTLEKHRALMRGIYQDAFDYCRPNQSEWGNEEEGGERQVEIYDDTAQESVGKFAARFQEAMIPSNQNWFMFELPEYIKHQIQDEVGEVAAVQVIDEVELDLQRQSDIFFDYIHRSNLDIKADEAFHDLAIGTLAMWINETDDQAMPFRFSVIPLHQSLFGEGEDGTVADVGRQYEMEAQNVWHTWSGMGNVNKEVKDLIDKDPTKKIKILEITILDRINGWWDYHVINETHNVEIYGGTFRTNPAVVLRYRRNTSEVFGRGPCIFKLPTIRVLNKREELLLRSEHRTVGGIYLAADDQVFDPYTTAIIPDTVIPVADVEKSLKELPYTGRIDIVEERRRSQQADVRRGFFAQEFANPTDPVRSATEISIMYQEMIRDMGGSFGRIKREFLDQMVSRITDILVRRGLMKEIAVQRNVINYRYTSPIAKAQDIKELEATQTAIGTSLQLLGPEVTFSEYNAGRTSRAIGERLGIDKTLLNTQQEKEQMAQQRQQAQQMAMQQQQ